MTTAPDGLFQYGGVPVGGSAVGYGVGNVYYVMQSTNALYSTEFLTSKVGHYADKSARVHTSITTALAATVSSRNDYVIVMPDTSDYDEGATLTMSKANVHLICPAGLGAPVGCMRGASIDPNTGEHAITITGRAVGCWFLDSWLCRILLYLCFWGVWWRLELYSSQRLCYYIFKYGSWWYYRTTRCCWCWYICDNRIQ